MLESLEDRRLLSFTDLAAIEGVLFYDLGGNARQPIPDQPVRLYRDGDGNGLYDGAPADPLQDTQLTNADGWYRFATLTADTYFVVQPPEPSGNIQPPPVPLVRTIVITPADAAGTEGLPVDEFDEPQSLTAQPPPLGISDVSSWVPAPSVLGVQRKLLVNAIAGDGKVNVEVDEAGNGRFSYSENVSTSGNATVIWDGSGGDPTILNPTGLGGVDLTGGGVQDSFLLNIHSSQVPSVETLTVYSDATRASQVTLHVPGFTTDLEQRIKFSDFTPLRGFAAADFANVGAVEFRVRKDSWYLGFALDYDLDRIVTIGPTILYANLPFDVTSSIRLVKQTNDTNNDAAPGRLLPVGSEVTWTYLVTNEGNESIAGLVVTDDQSGVNPVPVLVEGFNSGDRNTNRLLEPGEVWRFTAKGTGIAGQYVNLGTVTGVGAVTAVTLQAEDMDFYFGVQPGIRIVKTTNDHDNDSNLKLPAGSPVTWRYTVANSGNVPLGNVQVTDNQPEVTPVYLSGDTNSNGQLDLTETWIYTATGTAVAGAYSNEGRARASDVTGTIAEPVVAVEWDEYFGVAAAIDIKKATNGLDADLPTGPVVNAGSRVTWTYVVTNPGNVPLSNVAVMDDNGTSGNPADDFSPAFVDGDGNGNGQLDLGETWCYQATGLAQLGLYGNAATATGIDPLGKTVYDMDPSHYFGVQASPGSGQRPVIVLGPDKNPGTPQAVRVVDSDTWEVLPEFEFVAYEDSYVGGTRVAVADLDGDGIDEIITAPGRNRAPEVRVFTLEGEPVPGFPQFLAYSSAFRGGVELTAADVNGDGKPDVITVPSFGAAEVRVFFNRFDSQNPSQPAFQADPDISFYAFSVAAVGGSVVTAADMGSLVGGSFVNALDGKSEIVVGTGGGSKAAVAVFEVSGMASVRVQTFSPFTALNPNFTGGVSMDVAQIEADSVPGIVVGMGVNGTSRIEVWTWNTATANLSLRGAIPAAFTDPSNNAPVRVAAVDADGDGLAETILAVQGPIGTTGEIHRFEITGTSPFGYQQAAPLTGLSGPWFIATSRTRSSATDPQLPIPNPPAPELVWTNAVNAYDVNNDGNVTPLDALETINYINMHPDEIALPARQTSPPRFFDCNVDGVIGAADVLFVVNSFNRRPPYSGEGERSELIAGTAGMPIPRDADDDLVGSPNASSRFDVGGDSVPDAFGVAIGPDTQWRLPDVEVELPRVPAAAEPARDDPHWLELEPVLEEIAADITT